MKTNLLCLLLIPGLITTSCGPSGTPENRDADGKWKCIVDTYNSDLPAPAASGPAKK